MRDYRKVALLGTPIINERHLRLGFGEGFVCCRKWYVLVVVFVFFCLVFFLVMVVSFFLMYFSRYFKSSAFFSNLPTYLPSMFSVLPLLANF